MPQSLAEIKILVVEDDDGREILAYTLAVEGATVTAVSTAHEALALLTSADIILDRLDPARREWPLAPRAGQSAAPTGPGHRDQRLRREPGPRLAAAPFAGKLLKPLDFDQVCAEIAVVLGSRA